MEVPKDKIEQKLKAYNEKQAGIRSSAPYDWSVETCTKYSGVTKHIFHNVLKEPYCTKDQNNSYGIPSELGAFVCAYAYAVKSYKECAEKEPKLAPHLRKFFEKHREILRNLEKEKRGQYERYILGSDPAFQFLSSYSSFVDRFSDKLAILFSIINDFPAENRLDHMQRVLSSFDAEIENIALEKKKFYSDMSKAPPQKDNLSLKALFHQAYDRNSWRKDYNTLFQRTNALQEFQEYAQHVKAIYLHNKKDENKELKEPSNNAQVKEAEELRLKAERAYHLELIKEFLSKEETTRAESFLNKQQELDTSTLQNYEKQIRGFLCSVSGALSTQPVLERFPLPDTIASSTTSVSRVYEIGCQILSSNNFDIADAALALIMADLPIYLKRELRNTLDRFQNEFEQYNHYFSRVLFMAENYKKQENSSFVYPREIAFVMYISSMAVHPGLEQMSTADAVSWAATSLLRTDPLKDYYKPLFEEKIIEALHQNYLFFIEASSGGETRFPAACINKLLTYLRLQHSIRAANLVEKCMVQYCDDYEWCRKAIQDAIDPLKELESYQAFETQFHNLMYDP